MINIYEYGKCADDILGTGLGSCPISSLGDLKGIGLLKKGVKLNLATDSLNENSFRNLITSGKLQQLVNSYNFETTTPENERSTSSDGIMKTVRNGKPMYSLVFQKGETFDKALQSLKGQNRWDLLFYFDMGVLLALNIAETDLKGFNLGMLDVETFAFKQGAEEEFSKVVFQLIDSEEFNSRRIFFSIASLGFNPLQIDGVVESYLYFNTPPIAGSSILEVKLVESNNRSIVLSSLFDTATDWKVLTNGDANVVTSVSISGDIATLTLTDALVSTDKLEVSLNGIKADEELRYYKSNTATAVI